MSWWTHIHGTVSLEASEDFPSVDDLEKYINYVLNEIRKRSGDITGSEGNAIIYINKYPNPSSFNSSHGEGYCNAYLAIHGHLRDRIIDRTEKELRIFLDSLQRYFTIDDIFIKIEDYTNSKIFMNDDFNLYKQEQIKLPFDYKTAPDPEKDSQEVVDKYEEKEEQHWRIQHLNFERYFKKLFNKEKIQYYRWVFDHLDLNKMDDILSEIDSIANVTISKDYLERRKLRKYPIPKEFEEELNNPQPTEE